MGVCRVHHLLVLAGASLAPHPVAIAHPQLGYETYKAKRVIESRDISYAFTNLIANDYYSISEYRLEVLRVRCSEQNRTTSSAFFAGSTVRPRRRTILRSSSTSLSRVG